MKIPTEIYLIMNKKAVEVLQIKIRSPKLLYSRVNDLALQISTVGKGSVGR